MDISAGVCVCGLYCGECVCVCECGVYWGECVFVCVCVCLLTKVSFNSFLQKHVSYYKKYN